MPNLVDTHSFLWFTTDNPLLPPTILAVMQNPENELLLSMASIWEIAIKHSIGKLPLVQPFEQFITEQMQKNAISLLPIELRHTVLVSQLPFYHRDPFDRLLIAQSLVENIPILSVDTVFDAYGVIRIG